MKRLLILVALLMAASPVAASHETWAKKGLAFPPAVVEYIENEMGPNHNCGILVGEEALPLTLESSNSLNRVAVIRLIDCDTNEFNGVAWHEAIYTDGAEYTFGRLLKFVTRDGRTLHNILDGIGL